MKRTLTSVAKWDASRAYWKINVQKEGTRRSFYESTPGRRGKALCEAKAIEWLDSKSVIDPRFEQAWNEFIDQKKKEVSKTYIIEITSFGRTWLLPALEKRRLSTITSMDFQRLIDKMADAGRAKKTIKDLLAVVSAFAKFCRKNRYEFETPEDLSIKGKPKKEKRILTRADIATIFNDNTTTDHAAVIPEHYIHAFRLCIITGERRGEIAGLKWSDVSEDRISIERSINRINDETPGKTENAQRTIPISSVIRQELDAQREYLKTVGIISPWIFPDIYGNCSKPDNLYRHWIHYCDVHEIPKTTFHEIRHTSISLYKNDMPEELIKRLAGHSESMDTFGVYGHETEGDLDRTREIMDAVMKSLIS